MRALGRIAVLVAVGILGVAQVAEAQYFGRNKVQYENHEFSILHTPHFHIYYYPEERDAAEIAGRMAERWYARHAILLGDSLHGAQPIILYSSFPQFEETNVVAGIGVGTGGVTEPTLRRVVLPFAGPLDETNHVIGHELVHAFQFDITGEGHPEELSGPSAENLPLWFIEGMAEYLSLGPRDPNTAMWMRDATRKHLPDLSELESSKYFPYRFGQSLLAYIGGRWGDKTIGTLLRVAGERKSIRPAINAVLHISPDSLARSWHAALHAAYDTVAAQTSQPSRYGPELISSGKGNADLNASPVISPDGRRLVFFSSRDQFSIDLYLADATTGRVLHDIYKTALDSHLENLEFISSAGGWDPAGERFVFAAVREGRPSLEILNVETEKVEREIPFRTLDEIFDPAWSPDGRYIAFSALNRGFSDLFLYDLDKDSLRQLTQDPYADFQPAWSPDGRRLAFVTDRFTSRLSDLEFGNYRLALFTIENGRIEGIPGFTDGKNINPQWSGDGKELYFLSDHNGISNIYRLTLASGLLRQLTNVYAGVSGITALSPALSVARDTSRLVYSAFENGNFSIYRIDTAALLAGSPLQPAFAGGDQALLPPRERENPTLVHNLEDPEIGLPPDTVSYLSTPYSSALRLVGIAQPSLVGGTSPFGAYFGGGAMLYWSDILGDHDLATALSLTSGSWGTDVAGLVGYWNNAHRFSWGTVAQQIPYTYGGVASGLADVNGTPVYAEQDYLYRQVDRALSFSYAYPFSQTLRTELSAGYENMTFSQQVETYAVLLDGTPLSDVTQTLPAPPSLNLGHASVALVRDNSIFGATSPVLGSRFRFEISPTFGSLSLADVLGDYRIYLMPLRPFTLAARLLHYGRYGADADDPRLYPLYLGSPGLIRGYDGGFLSSNLTAVEVSGTNPVYDPLYGSKILVGNLELRFPPLGLLGLGEGYYGFLPIELGTFFDTGVAWSGGSSPWFFGGDRSEVNSVGEALRMNLFGYAILEVDYARPLNPTPLSGANGWTWVFNLTEGF